MSAESSGAMPRIGHEGDARPLDRLTRDADLFQRKRCVAYFATSSAIYGVYGAGLEVAGYLSETQRDSVDTRPLGVQPFPDAAQGIDDVEELEKVLTAYSNNGLKVASQPLPFVLVDART